MMTTHFSRATRRFRSVSAVAAGALMLAAPAVFAQAPSVSKSVKIGDGVYEIVANTTTGDVYAASVGPRGKNEAKIYVLDGQSLAVKSTIDVNAAPAFGLGINNTTQTLFTTNTRSGSVSLIDLKSGKVVATVSDTARPKVHTREVIVDEATNTAYVTLPGRDTSWIWVIDANTKTLAHIIPETGNVTAGIALDKANNQLFVTNLGTHEVAVIDLATKKISRQFPSGGKGPINLVFDAPTNRLFVSNQESGEVTVLDAKDGKVLKTIATGEGALGINLHPAAKRLYVANRKAGTVTVINAESYDVLATLETGTYPNTVAVNPATGDAFVTNKAKSLGRNAPADAKPVVDENGDTVTKIAK